MSYVNDETELLVGANENKNWEIQKYCFEKKLVKPLAVNWNYYIVAFKHPWEAITGSDCQEYAVQQHKER